MDRFRSPTMREDARAAREEELINAHESKCSVIRYTKFKFKQAARVLVDDYFKALDPDTLEFSYEDIADVFNEIASVLDGPYLELLSRLEGRFEDDMAQS